MFRKVLGKKANRLGLCLILGILVLFSAGSVSTLYASEDVHVSEGHQEHSSDHAETEKAHHEVTKHSTSPQTYHTTKTVNSILPFLVVLIPFISVFGLTQVAEEQSLIYTAVITLVCFLTGLFMIPTVLRGDILEFALETKFSMMSLAFFADSLSMLVGLVASFVWMIASFYTIEYLSHSKNFKRYCTFSLLSLSGMLGVVFTRNLFTLYIFFEMLTVASYVMVVHEETDEAKSAGIKYLVLGITGGLILFMSIVAIYSITGTADLVEISKLGVGIGQHPWMPYIFIGMITGFGVKAGMFPVHIWLPEAHPVAPAPASALLSGIMIKAGGYGIFRTIYNIVGVDFMRHQTVLSVVMAFAFINIFLGSAMAIRSKEIKQMLAYSSIAQIGYIILGATLLSPYGITGGAVHIFNHALIKGTLFMCAGVFIHQTGLRQLEDLKGIGMRMPITTACFTIAGFSMIGFPPFNGFVTKWFLALGCLQTADVGSYTAGIGAFAFGMLLLSSFMNLLYYGPVIYHAWFTPRIPSAAKSLGAHAASENGDPNYTMLIPLVLIALGIIIFGIFPLLSVNLADGFSQMVFH